MKKYLLLILTMLSVSIGAWADPTQFGSGGSTWEKNGTVLTLTIANEADVISWSLPDGLTLDGVNTVKVVTASGVSLNCGNGSAMHCIYSVYGSASVMDLSEASINLLDNTLSASQGEKMFNIVVPAAYASNLAGFIVSNVYWSGGHFDTNNYTVSGTAVRAYLGKTTNLAALSDISSTATTLKILNEVGAIDLSSVLVADNTLDLTGITTGSTGSNTITVVSGVKVICLSDDVKSRVTGTDAANINVVNPVISCTANEFSTKLTALTSAGVAPTSITITSGTVSTEMLSSMNVEGLTYLNLANATVTPALNTIELPSTLKALVLPAAATMDATLKTKVTSSNLDYVYIPTNQAQDEDNQTTADYIWVNKPGGLSNALDNEAKLRSSWYMVVESDVALNNDDVNFWGPGETARVMQYRYLDFSGANVTPTMLYNYRVTDQLAYRIILPNDWTGDDMAVFAANPNCGNIAAVYSYTGTDHKRLDILELHDKAYMPTALNNPRIVRSGTTSIRVVSGHYGSNPVYSKLGKNLLAAINNAASTITSVTIAVGSGIYTLQNEGQENVEDVLVSTSTTFAFTNTNLTELIMNYINNSNLTVDVHSCTNLQSLSMNEVTLAGIVANGITSLTTASLGHATVGSDVNLSGTALTSLLEVDLAQITGTLDVSNSTATSFDFTKLTAKSVNASNTDNLTSLDINGITLDNNEAWGVDYESATDAQKTAIDNLITTRTGTVEVTRTSGEYGNLNITVPEGNFNRYRIVPNATTLGNSVTECENGRGYLDWHAAFKNWLKTNYTSYLQDTETLNTNYNAWATTEWNNAKDYESYTGTLEEWKTLQGNSITDWEELFCESENVVKMTTAKTAFAGTFEAWYSQTYTTDGYLDTNISTDYTNATDKDDYDTEEEWKAAHYADKNGDNYKYVTTTATTAWEASTKSTPEPTCGSTYITSEIAEAHVELTVAGNLLSDNIGNIWLDTDGNGTADVNPTQSEIEILHVTGTVTTDDLDYIAGMTGLKTLDLSEATGVTYSDIIYAGLSTKTAIILPGTTNTEADMVTAMNAFQTAGYECVGYYTAKNESSKKLNVYGYNGTVANLKTGNITTQINATAAGETGTMVEQPKLIDTNTDLTFLPVYGNTTASVPYLSTDNISYPQATPALLTAFREKFNSIDYPYSVDMSWLDISNLGVDFSGVKCRHLVIPQNTMAETTTRNSVVYHNDFTDETADAVVEGTQHRYYKYNEMVYAVSTYKSNNSPYGLQAYYDGKGILFTNGYGGLDETATLTYLRSAGQEHLDDVVSHMSPLLQGADVIMLKGTLTEDIDGLNALTNDRIDLTRATMTSMSGFNNDNVKYLALPDGMNNAIAATSADDFAFSGCAALRAVGAYDPTNNKYTVHSTANTVTFTDETKTACSSQENSVFEITKMCAPNSSRSAGSVLGLTEVEMSGYLTLADIQADGGTTEPGLNCNNNCSITTADFSNAVFMNNEDMTFTGAHWNGNALTSILLPTDKRQKRIPAQSLYNYAALTEICIPYNYETIGNAAFYLANLGHITTTDANGALVDNGEHTFTFSKNLKEIGEAPSSLTTGEGNAAYPTPLAEPVFFSYGYHDLTDIYVLRTGYEDGGDFNPTKCYRNAFGAGPTYGWGGFNGGNVYCREKYMNGSQLYTVLHFPDLASVSNDEDKYNKVKEAYTDPTRVYTKKDQTGAVDANGNTPEWPTFAELGRAYNQAMRGLVWNDWTIDETAQAQGNVNGSTITTPPGNPSDVSLVTSPTKFNVNYTGWHEFVLALATYVAPDENTDENNKIYRSYELDNNWYTFCIPFNMTEEEVIQLLGVPAATEDIVTTLNELEKDTDGKVTNGESITQVTTALLPEIRTISGVVRNSNDNSVNISTSESLSSVTTKGTGTTHPKTYYMPSSRTYVANTEAGYGSDVYLRAGYPYLIKPYKIKGSTIAGNNLGKQVVTRYTFTLASSAVNYEATKEDITAITSFARPYEGHKIQAVDQTGAELTHEDSNKPYNYTFVGQFWKQELPLYCFYQSSHKWYHYTTKQSGWYWNPYICIIAVTNESDEQGAKGEGYRDETHTQYPDKKGVDEKGGEVFDKNLQIVYSDGLSDDFSNNAREYRFVFDGDIMEVGEGSEATAIEVLDGVRLTPVSGKVYNMAGQHVGNTLNGLPKGMYIVNGKKYVIK